MLSAGQLNERVTFQSVSRTKGDMGGQVETWADHATVWANVRQPSSRELVAAAQMQSTMDHVITVRYRTDITSDMRVMWRGRALEIVGDPYDPDGRRVEMKLRCMSGARNG